jgi:hypothetical protein
MEAAVADRSTRDPFAPVEMIVSVLLGMGVIILLLVVGLGVVEKVASGHTNVSFATIGEREACATTSLAAVPYSSGDVASLELADDTRLRPPHEAEVCLEHPTVWQKAASALAPVGDVVFGLGGLWLVRRVIRAARREGLFTACVARRTRVLGWFLLAMGGVWPFLAGAGRGVVVQAALPGVSWSHELWSPHISPFVVTVALGVITFARILERAVPLQAEVDATV